MNKKVIYLGYRIDEPRHEAVTINASQYRQVAERLGMSCEVIAYDGTAFSPRKLWAFLRRLGRACRQEPGIIVHDFFVMPGLSLIVRTYLGALGLSVRYIKTFINPPGTARMLSMEGLLRLVLNNRLLCKLMLVSCESATYFEPLWSRRLKTLDIPLRYEPGEARDRDGPIVAGYLGHPLRKKGVHLFPEIVRTINSARPDAVEFRFSFSELCDIPDIREALAEINNCSVTGPVTPREVFQDIDVYILPIDSCFAASGSFNTVLEAVACGCCVLTADLSALPKILTSETAELVGTSRAADFADAMIKLIDQPDLLKAKRGSAIEAYSRNYEGAGERIEKQLRELYEH